ncbi:MAG: hypothetical protein AAFQ83_05345 [Bacteroidota bacterium]
MKATIYVFSLACCFLFVGCETPPHIEEVYRTRVDFDQILEILKNSGRKARMYKDLFTREDLTEITDVAPKIYFFQVQFRPRSRDTVTLYGEFRYQTEFRQFQIGDQVHWLPYSWEGYGKVDTTQTHIELSPSFSLWRYEDTLLEIEQWIRISIGEKGFRVSSRETRDENGDTKTSSVRSWGGIGKTQGMNNLLSSVDEELRVDISEFILKEYAEEKQFSLYKDIFGTRKEIVGVVSHGFLQ